MRCPVCRKELYDNGDRRFNCPFCGAQVEGSGTAPKEEAETPEMRCRRLERELALQRVRAEIEEQSANDHFWCRGGNPFSMIYRQTARNALDRGDIESAKRNLAKAEKSTCIGCLLHIAVFVAMLVAAAASKL